VSDMTQWTFPGSRWWRCDLHTHTPASAEADRYSDPGASPEDWVKAALSAGVEVVAVTDHNTPRWIPEVQRAARGTRLIVFPGVEITVNHGIHVLAILPVGVSPDAIAALLGACKIPGEKFGKKDTRSPSTFADVAELIDTKHGGVCIAAHADGVDGFLKTLVRPTPEGRLSGDGSLQDIVKNPHLLGVEANQGDLLLLAFLDNTKVGYRRPGGPLPLLEGSDAHSLADLGRRWTWIKMARPDLEGLRLALLDGEMSVRRGSTERGDPNAHADQIIESIEIENARFMGRGGPLCIRLNPWLNTVIGGHGTGKSSIVEFLRIAMRRESEIPEALRRAFEKYTRPYTSRHDEGLLTPATIFRVVVRRHGQRFRVQWSQDGALAPIAHEERDGSWTPAPGEVRSRFPVRIFSQKQVYGLAEEPNALLRIIDESPPVDAAALRVEIERAESEFLALRARVRVIAGELRDEPRLRGALDDVRRRIAVFEDSEHREVLNTYQVVEDRQRALDGWADSFSKAVSRLEALPGELVPDDLTPGVFPAAPGPETAEAAVLTAKARAEAALAAIRRETEALADRARAALAAFREAVTREKWATHVTAARGRHDDLKRRLLEAGAGDPAEYGRLVQQRAILEGRLRDLEGRRKTMTSISAQADEHLARAGTLRAQLTERRKHFLETVLADNTQVRMTIVPYGDHRDAEQRLREAIDKDDDTFRDDIWSEDDGKGVLRHVYVSSPPGDPPDSFLAGLNSLKQRFLEVAAGTMDPVLHGKLQTHLRKLRPEALDRLQAMLPEDAITVEYRGQGDHDFRPIAQGSPGQKSAAVLAFLLSHGSEPLVLDQPEDDLDNQLISELIVAQLRQVKAKRQMLVVTHNPNIVVNGDAELVLPLVARAGQTHLDEPGGLQDVGVRDTICRVMEGGRDALDRRYRRIRGGADRV
jgi:hypothetical protein